MIPEDRPGAAGGSNPAGRFGVARIAPIGMIPATGTVSRRARSPPLDRDDRREGDR